MMTDPIADMLTRIHNAVRVERLHVEMPASKVKRGLADVLKREGYIWDWKEVTAEPVSQLRIDLKYGPNGERVIRSIKRVSKPGRRIYSRAKDLRPVLNGLGISVVSTSRGVLSDREARQRHGQAQAQGAHREGEQGGPDLRPAQQSSDALRRNGGRRGLDILNRMQKDTARPLRVTDMDVDEVRGVDDKLIALAKRLKCPVLTNDYNLNRVAEIQGVTVLNVNELANAVRLVFLPGESIRIEIIQEGKEVGQGVGYLDDGTMIVVEEGRRYIGATINVIVTKMLQTAAGRMIFARPDLSSGT